MTTTIFCRPGLWSFASGNTRPSIVCTEAFQPCRWGAPQSNNPLLQSSIAIIKGPSGQRAMDVVLLIAPRTTKVGWARRTRPVIQAGPVYGLFAFSAVVALSFARQAICANPGYMTASQPRQLPEIRGEKSHAVGLATLSIGVHDLISVCLCLSYITKGLATRVQPVLGPRLRTPHP